MPPRRRGRRARPALRAAQRRAATSTGGAIRSAGRFGPGPRAAVAVLLSTLVLLSAAAPAGAQEAVGETFRAANAALAEGRHEEAATAYEHLLGLGFESPNLLYNLAVAQRRLGRPGRAIYSLERLLRLEPGDDDARRFLDDLRTEVGKSRRRGEGTAGLFPRRSFLHAAAARMQERSIALATLLASFLTFGLLWFRRFARGEALRLGLGIAAPVAAALLLAAAVLLWAKLRLEPAAGEAIVLPPTGAALHEGPTSGSPETFRLPEGDMVRVLSRTAEWTEVQDEGGRRGWVAPGAVGELHGPFVPTGPSPY
ncbi:MAG: SH3 domain-containing protein, partial [Deltaproteobacteria bacterium]|nr:SH3 domain-containing protein [Deltaproteobacteria bacterium]